MDPLKERNCIRENIFRVGAEACRGEIAAYLRRTDQRINDIEERPDLTDTERTGLTRTLLTGTRQILAQSRLGPEYAK